MRTILLLMVNPKGTQQLRLDEEVRRIQQGLERARNRDQFRLFPKWAVTVDDFRRAMLDHEPEIVHFAGHGSGGGVGAPDARDFAGAETPEARGLAFEDERGQAQEVSGEALARHFELFADHLKCVVLNACYSEIQADAIARHIDYVIGMNRAIGDAAALKFAIGFYDAIAAGKSYQFAFHCGRSAIDLNRIPEHLTPVLKQRPDVAAALRPARPPSPASVAADTDPASTRHTVAVQLEALNWDPRILQSAQRKLARIVGPMAEIFVRDAARQARSLEQLYEILAKAIPSEEDRRQFLRSRSG